MGRAPCCEKMGLKKGPWTPEEDQILINYINTYGHANWRALPKQAGLLRCGKSCRLRWTNYLRPDIKRGNFTREDEETIINLHEMLGNRWSAIAARLPGRTDNEIKNVWHTHLKKRLPQNQKGHEDTKRKPKKMKKLDSDAAKQEQEQQQQETKQDTPLSPPQCSSDMSTLTTTSDYDNNEHNINNHHDMSINNNNSSSSKNDNNNIVDSPGNNDLALDEDFWSEVLSADNSGETSDRNNFPATIINGVEQEFQFSFFAEEGSHLGGSNSSTMCDGMDFWYDVYARAEELTELLEL